MVSKDYEYMLLKLTEFMGKLFFSWNDCVSDVIYFYILYFLIEMIVYSMRFVLHIIFSSFWNDCISDVICFT